VQRAYPPQKLIRDYMRSLTATGSSATIIMDPTVAELLHDLHGFGDKRQLSTWLSENVEKTAGSFWGNGVVSTINTTLAHQGLEPYASWHALPEDALIKPFNNPRAIQVLVVGGAIQTTWFVTDFRLGRGVSIDKWR
jgi:hypothetical protein